MIDSGKHSSLSYKCINDEEKSFLRLLPIRDVPHCEEMKILAVANVIKTFFSLSLRPGQNKLECLSQTVL
jgi:hypothetical protein